LTHAAMDFVIGPESAGKTVKEFLRANVEISRNMLIALKNKPDGITVNHGRVTVRFVLSSGDVLGLNHENLDELNQDKSYVAENRGLLPLLDIIYEDDYIFAANKPPGMPSHPSPNHFDDTFANLAVAYFRGKNMKSLYRAANRLDRNTSGIVLSAKDKMTSAKLNGMMMRGEIKKTYIALLNGDMGKMEGAGLEKIGGALEYDPHGKTGRITAPICREQGSIIKRVCAIGGDYAETGFKVLQSGENTGIGIVEAYPKTGRTHQIRLHFCAIGLPLLGEDLYCENNANPNYRINRHALHARSLEFAHPASGERILLSCDLPADMKGIVDAACPG